jgi:hypothetical protein
MKNWNDRSGAICWTLFVTNHCVELTDTLFLCLTSFSSQLSLVQHWGMTRGGGDAPGSEHEKTQKGAGGTC